MMTAKEYLGDLNGGSLVPKEGQVVAELLLQDLTQQQWNTKLIDENIFQRNNPKSNKRIAAMLLARIKPLGHEFWEMLATSDKNLSIQLNLLATLINSPIIADFMKSVLLESYRLYEEKLTKKHWDDFFDARVTAMPELADFSEGTQARFRINAIRILSEADYLESTSGKKLQGVFILPEVERIAEKLNRADVVDIMRCSNGR